MRRIAIVFRSCLFRLRSLNFDQAETKTVGFENRSGAYIRYVSTGSGETGRLQAGFIEIP
jgi:hypothetical protein